MTELRWYEDLLFWFLLRSPRISQITIDLAADDEGTSEDPDDDEELDDPELDFIPFLEQMYRGPSADRREQD